MTLSGQLSAAVSEFRDAHPELETPGGAHDRAHLAATEFAALLASRGIAAQVITGFRTDGPAILLGNMAVRVRGLVIDWTARQFAPAAPVPWTVPLAAWRREWPELNDAIAQDTETGHGR